MKKLQRTDVPLLHLVLGVVLVFKPGSQTSYMLHLQQKLQNVDLHPVLVLSWSAFSCNQPRHLPALPCNRTCLAEDGPARQ